MLVDPKTNELYVADGYGNRRVIVLDADTGAYKRHWGAYGNKPDDTQLPPYKAGEPPPKQFRTPVHGVALSNDGLLYVCDRTNDRLQVFKTDGTFVKEAWVAPATLGDGSTFDVDAVARRRPEVPVCSRRLKPEGAHPGSDFARGTDHVWHRRPATGPVLRSAQLATDSKGNLYTTETYHGRRLQKFVFKGLAPVEAKDQRTVWPKR
jgi:hypothetical protein